MEIDSKQKHPISIKLDASGMGYVKIGNFIVPHTRTVEFTGKAGELPKINVEILCIDGVEIEATAEFLAQFVDPREDCHIRVSGDGERERKAAESIFRKLPIQGSEK